MTDNKINWR